MRAKLLLLAVAFAASHASKNDKIIDQVFSSWLDGPVNYGDHWRSRREAADQTQRQTEFDRNNQFQFETAEEHHGRSKRAANPFLNAAANVLTPNRFCNQPGYTGEFCQYPICTEANPRVVDHEAISGDGADIDAAFLGNSCNGTYVTVFDDLIYNIKITITAGGNINPSWDLVDSNGKHWFFDELISRSPSVLSGIYSTLPPGTYYITATPDVNNAACNVKIKARTRVVIEGGFITGETWATERNDFPDLKYTYQYTLNTFVAHPSNLRSPGRMAVVSIIEGNNVMSRPQELKIRYGCSYEYYYESFFCTNLNYYLWIVEGITWGGYPFRRLGSFQCLYNTNRPTPAPTGTTPAPTSPTSCANRGLLVTNPDNSTFCICNGLWQGATCSQLVCMNGGNDVGGSDCECPSGFQGRHCQDVVCADRGNTNFNIDKPTMVFAVRVRKQLQDVIDQVRQAIVDIVNLISVYDPEYVTRFGLVFYLDGRIEHVRGYGSLTETLNAWDRYAKNINDTKGNCTDYEFGALASALQAIEVSPRSKIYLITDSMPQDYTDDLETVFQLDSYFRVPIYPIYVEPAPGTLCYPDLHNPGYRALDDIAQRTEGLTFYVTNRTDVKNLLYNHLYATFYRTQLLLNDDLEVCSMQSTYKSISVDTTLDELVIVARGKGLTAYISGEATIQLTTKYAGNDIYIWSANGVVAGNYFINFLSSQALSSCAYRIFQRAYHTATFNNPQFELFWKFTESMNSEGYFQQPVVGFGASIAMHLTNFPTRIPAQYVQAELLIYATREGKQTPIYFSNGIWRDGCDYNFYFPPFTCRTAREILHFQFFTKDALGFPIQRSGSIYCSEYHPTFAPPTGCQHGGVPSPADNSTCFCPPGYIGKQCEQLVCFNGGTPLNFGFCQCPPGFVGTHCEYTSCIEKGPRPDIFIHGVDMVFAVETTTTAFGQIVYLNQMFPEILRDMVSQHRDWIRNFILVGYNSTWGGIIARSPAFDQHVVINALNDIATNPNNLDNTPEACNVTVKTWDALGSVLLRFNLRPASFINLFTASKPDQNDVQAIIEMYEMIRGKAIQLSAVIGYNSLGTPGYFCNNTFATFELLHDACRYSNGESYALQHAVVKNFVQTFPMKYMQGVVAHRRYSDCTDARYVSVPVDAYTQTLLVNVEGFQATVELYNGRGELQEYPNFRRIDTDTVTGWNFFALRAPCDPDWDNVGDYCIHYGMAESDYQTAYNVCHNSGGMLADDLSLDKHQYLIDNGAAFSFWFGLNNLNASGWQWDRESGVPSVPYNTSGVNYWNGGVVPNDPSKACAYFDSSKKTNNWNADSCTLKKKYVCQKHKFDYNYEPNRIDDDDLPAGKYYLKVTTQFPTGNAKGGCFIEVRAQSHLQVYSGFSADTHADYPDMDPIAGSPNNHIITFVDSAASFQQRTPILTHALIFSAHNDTMWDAVTFQPRSMCSFEWLSQEFACPDSKNPDNLMSIYHLGEDEYGHTFQRIVNAHCQKQTITCGNGGLRYNGVCVCTEYWQGKMCTVPVCVNGGRLDESNTACVCPIGFAGESCQYETCTNPMNVTFDNSGTSLVFVLEVTQNSKDTLNKLVDGLNTLLPTLPSGWFGNYILVTFNSKGVVYNQPLNTVVGLLGSISSQINGITDAASCSMPIYGAIAAAFQNPQLRPGAQLVLVSASVPSDTANRWSTIEQLTGAAPRILNFYSSTAACSAGAEIPNSDDALHLQRFAYASDGNNLFVDSTAISSMVAIYLPTLYKSNTIAHPTYFNNFTCGTPENWLLQIDNNSTDVYVTVSSDVGSLSVVDPYNDILSPDPIFNYKSQKIYHFERTHGGIYRFQVSSPGPCYVNVQANNGPQVWNAFVQPSAADPTGAHTDQITLSAIAGTNVAVFHLAGTDERHIGRLWYFTMWDPMQQKAIFGELYPRGKCHFEFYSDPFNCTANEPFYMSVMGVDQMYQPFTRQVAAFCIAGAPPPTGPTTTSTTTTTTTTTTMTTLPRTGPTTTGPLMTTTMGLTTTSYGLRDIQVDILFLIDTSASGKDNFDDYTNFIKTLMVPFTVSDAKTKVALVPVFGTDGGATFAYPFSSTNNPTKISEALRNIKEYINDFDTAGQWLGDALDQVADGTYKAPGSGYRAEITNHLIVYITSNSQFDDAKEAQQMAQLMRSQHYFGFLAIGYKGGARDALTTISGGSSCTYLPTDLNGLMRLVPTLQAIIFDNDKIGQYCNN